jgi:hypothetical protein
MYMAGACFTTTVLLKLLRKHKINGPEVGMFAVASITWPITGLGLIIYEIITGNSVSFTWTITSETTKND